MSKVLVSLIDEFPVRNLQFIKEKMNEADLFLFITTEKLENNEYSRADAIAHSLKIDSNIVLKIIVNPYSIPEIDEELSNISGISSNEFIVNISGGSKLMSIACLNFFRETNSKIFYVPSNIKNYTQISPHLTKSISYFAKHITLKEHINSHGLITTEIQYNSSSFEETKSLMHRAIAAKGKLRKISQIKNSHSFPTAKEKEFYSGGWFEEYTYNTIKQHFKLNNSQIGYKVKIENQNTNNEYDVVFILNDKLFLIECKAYSGRREIKDKIENSLYKLGALDDDFGILAQSVLITTFNLHDYSQNMNNTLTNRATDINVLFFQMYDLIKNSFLDRLV